jgi:hypothetical protein
MSIQEKIDELAETKEWQALSEVERKFIEENFGSEDQYQALRKVNHALTTSGKSMVSANPGTLNRLHRAFQKQYAPQWRVLPLFKVPAYATVLLMGLSAFAGWYLATSEQPVKPVSVNPVVQRDTVYIAAQRDTVFVQRVVYREIEVIREKSETQMTLLPIPSQHEQSLNAVGVNMKEKSELDNFLVSGSE